jgi:hypothetical protein
MSGSNIVSSKNLITWEKCVAQQVNTSSEMWQEMLLIALYK